MTDLKNLHVWHHIWTCFCSYTVTPCKSLFFVHFGTAETSCELISNYFFTPIWWIQVQDSLSFSSDLGPHQRLRIMHDSLVQLRQTINWNWQQSSVKPKRDLGDNQRLSHNHIVSTLSSYARCYKNMDDRTLNVARWIRSTERPPAESVWEIGALKNG